MTQQLDVPEYYPPPRVEVWLTLPPGVVVERDYPDYEPWSLPEPRYPQAHSEVSRRFRKEFSNDAALRWGLDVDRSWLLNKTMKAVFSGSRIEEAMFGASHFLRRLQLS